MQNKDDKEQTFGPLFIFGLVQIVSVIIWGVSVERRISIEATRFEELERRILNLDTPLGRKVTMIEQRQNNNDDRIITLSIRNNELDGVLRRLPVLDDRQERLLKMVEDVKVRIERMEPGKE